MAGIADVTTMKGANTSITLQAGDGLVIVDVQNDFLPGGSLAVPRGDEVIPVLNDCLRRAGSRHLPVFATRDWHPVNHCSFRSQGGPWPAHCVAGSAGAEFAPALDLPPDVIVISKGTAADREAYSGFAGTDLESRLRIASVRRLFIGGLATDYCVLNTVKDALRLGFAVLLLSDAIRPVNVRPDDSAKAIAEMIELGALPVELHQLAA